jgi:hypothetical protein
VLRHIDGPDKVYLSSKEAAAWLGLERKQFEALAALENWLRPVHFGRSKKWHWMDVVAFGHVLHRRERVKTPGINEKS